GQADHLTAPVADGADAVQRAADPRPVIRPKLPHALHHIRDIGGGDGHIAEIEGALWIARLRQPPEVEHDFEQIDAATLAQGGANARRQRDEQQIEIIGDDDLASGFAPFHRAIFWRTLFWCVFFAWRVFAWRAGGGFRGRLALGLPRRARLI